MCLVVLLAIVAASIGGVVDSSAGAQRMPSELTMELGDVVVLPADGVTRYGGGPPILDVHPSVSGRWFVITARALGASSLLFVTDDASTTCPVRVVPEGTLSSRSRTTVPMSVGDALHIPRGDIVGYREGDPRTIAVHVSSDGSEIVVVGLRRGRAALLLEHRDGTMEIRQLAVGS